MFIPNVDPNVLKHYNTLTFKRLLEDLNDHSDKHLRTIKSNEPGLITFQDFKTICPYVIKNKSKNIPNEIIENVKSIRKIYGIKDKICCIYGTVEKNTFDIFPVEYAKRLLYKFHDLQFGAKLETLIQIIESESFQWFNH